MADKAPPAISPPNIYEVEEISRRFQQLAEIVSTQLSDFHEWIQRLPGKMVVCVASPVEGSDKFHMLMLARAKGGWELRFKSATDESGYPVENASLDDKCIIASMLPELLQKIYDEQRSSVTRLKAAANILEKLPNIKGGK